MTALKPLKDVQGIVFHGFGGHARSVFDVAISLGISKFLFVDGNARRGETFAGAPVVRDLPEMLEIGWALFPTSGQADQRKTTMAIAIELGFDVCSIVSPNASIGYACEIGKGVFVGHQAHIGPCARIGDAALINSGAVVEHDVIIGAFTHVSVNATVAGRTQIGERCFLGAGSTVIDKLSIANGVTLGAGACAVRDITVAGTYTGQPARRLR